MYKAILLLLFISSTIHSQNTTTDTSIGKNGDNATYNYISLTSKPYFQNIPDNLTIFSEYIESYFNKGIKPAKLKNNAVKVFISFIVEKDGSLSDFTVLKDPGNGVAEEIKRIVNQSPKWVPGRFDNQTVRVRCNTPVEIKY